MFFIIYFISFGPYMGGSLKELIDDGFNKLLEKMNPQIWFEQMLVNGLLAGLFSVLSFIPTIAILFFFINFVQQIGIMSRVSALTDNTLDKFGLSGRSIVNVLTGLGCSVPAVMMARSSNSYKERFISILITPFITCSARIIVISYVCNLVFGPIFG
jgi:ferrous iron transport protein B